MINFFSYCIKKMNFSSSPKGTPHERCRRTMKKTSLQWKLMELGGIPLKNDEFFTGDLYSTYVVLQGIGPPSWITIIYIYIRNSLWVEAILDVWSS